MPVARARGSGSRAPGGRPYNRVERRPRSHGLHADVLEALTRRRLAARRPRERRGASGRSPASALGGVTRTERRRSGGARSGEAVRGRPRDVRHGRARESRARPANVLFELERRARVQLDAVRMGIGRSDVRWTTNATLGPGSARARVAAGAETPVGSYVMRLTVGENGKRRVYGRRRRPARARRGTRRPRARRRGLVRAPFLPPGRADGAPRPGRRAVVHADVPPRRPRARPEPPERRADRSPDG